VPYRSPVVSIVPACSPDGSLYSGHGPGLEKSVGHSASQEERVADLCPSGRAEGTDGLDPHGTQPNLSRAVDRTSPSQTTCWLTRERAGDPSRGTLVRFTP
jgi:hypothetical protein